MDKKELRKTVKWIQAGRPGWSEYVNAQHRSPLTRSEGEKMEKSKIEIMASGQGLYVVYYDHHQIARISNSNFKGRWYLRDDKRAAQTNYAGVEVTKIIHDNDALVDTVISELS